MIAIAVLMILVGAVAAAAQQRTVSSRAVGPKQPRIWGDRVVYLDDSSGEDVWLNDLAVPSNARLPWAYSAAQERVPAIQGAIVAWKQGNSVVKSRFLGRAPFTVSTSSGLVTGGVRVYSNRYAWIDTRGGRADGVLYTKLVGGADSAVDSAGFAQTSPSLYGNLLVWEDWRAGSTADVFLKDFSAGSPSNLTPSTSGTDQRRPSVFGTRVVWDDARTGDTDIRFFDKATMGVGSSTDLTPEIATTLTSIMLGGIGGDTHAHVATTTGFEVGDYVAIGAASTLEYLKITAVSAGTLQLDFASAAQFNHVSASSVRTVGQQISPAIYSDADGYLVVWQDSRKSDPALPDQIWKVRGARFEDNGSVEDTFQVPGAANVVQTSPQVFGDRVVWENESGGAASIGTYELMPYAYDAGAGATETARVLARASFAGHTAQFRYGIGTTPGAVDVSGGWSADSALTQAWLVPNGSASAPDELDVPAGALALTPGQTYYVAVQANEDGSYSATETSDGFTVDTAAPPAPSPSAAEASGKVTLSWAAVADTGGSGMDAYEIWRREGANPAIKVGEVTETAFTDDGTYGLASAPVDFTTYHYQVVARDGARNRTASSEVDAIPRPAGAITIASSANLVSYGTAVNLTTRLTVGSAAENPTVTLYRRTLIGSVETTVGTRVMSPTGVAAFTGVKPSEGAYYVVRWTGGASNGAASASTLVRVIAKVSIMARPVIGTRGRVTVFSGGVWPYHTAKWVYLQRYYAGRWRNVKPSKLSSASTYRILWPPNVRGRLYLRAYFADNDGRHLPGERRLWYRVR
jgi:beta propeller repeat protein